MKWGKNWDSRYKIGDYQKEYMGDEYNDFKKEIIFTPMAFIEIKNFECLWKKPVDPRLKIGDICKAYYDPIVGGYFWTLISWLDGILIVDTGLKEMNFSFVNKKNKRIKKWVMENIL